MNPVVTARVPEGVRSRGLEVLAEIGATTSDLVNAAFNYVIQERKLPKPLIETDAVDAKRKLSASQRRELNQLFANMKVPVPAEWQNEPFDALLDQAMEDRYARVR